MMIKPINCLEKRGRIWSNDVFQKYNTSTTNGGSKREIPDFRCFSYIVKHPEGGVLARSREIG